jgi:hypothetical protein
MNKHNYTEIIKDNLNKLDELKGFDKRWLKYKLSILCYCGAETTFLTHSNHCN